MGAFVESAARFLGGQPSVSLINEIEPLEFAIFRCTFVKMHVKSFIASAVSRKVCRHWMSSLVLEPGFSGIILSKKLLVVSNFDHPLRDIDTLSLQSNPGQMEEVHDRWCSPRELSRGAARCPGAHGDSPSGKGGLGSRHRNRGGCAGGFPRF